MLHGAARGRRRGKGHRVLHNVEELVDDRRALEAPPYEEEHGHHASHLLEVLVVEEEGTTTTDCLLPAIAHLPTYDPPLPATCRCHYLPPPMARLVVEEGRAAHLELEDVQR